MGPKGPEPDPERLLSGHPSDEALPEFNLEDVTLKKLVLFTGGLTGAIGPWGASFSGNLTPHETGTGNWTLENFKRVMREGKLKGMEDGRPLLPPMPWYNFAHLSDQDIESIFTYLHTLPPAVSYTHLTLPTTSRV